MEVDELKNKKENGVYNICLHNCIPWLREGWGEVRWRSRWDQNTCSDTMRIPTPISVMICIPHSKLEQYSPAWLAWLCWNSCSRMRLSSKITARWIWRFIAIALMWSEVLPGSRYGHRCHFRQQVYLRHRLQERRGRSVARRGWGGWDGYRAVAIE